MTSGRTGPSTKLWSRDAEAFSGCLGFSNIWCDYVTKLDCSRPPHNELIYLCGTDGKTYNSRCSLNKITCTSNVSMAYAGKCVENNPKQFEKFVCEYIGHIICHGLEPVCGNDQVTYDNGCELVKAHCKNKNIFEDYKGFCVFTTTLQPVTLDPFCQTLIKAHCHGVNPICAMNNVTYDNDCEFEKKKCKNPKLRIKKMGVC